ncbi:MAG: hypothetical protein KatS3mg011_2215 [Acidimicrobiia bacterium]|nr:MAG: hypothetical protein KatS3mg011_2215 [Acidimicrobiia bacterium]
MSLWLIVLVAVLGGLGVALQTQIAGFMDSRMGTLESVFVTYAGGGLAVTLLLAAARGGAIGQVRQLPWWVWTSGLLGLVIVGSIAFSAARLGVVRTLTVMTAAQFLFAGLIDHFGLLNAPVRPVDLPRAAGVVLLLAGAWMVLR